MILGVTGHRPNKLGGYTPANQRRLTAFCVFALGSYKPEKVITGMALGLDMAVARACVQLQIPFVAAIPFQGQESQWPEQSQREYCGLLHLAAEVWHVCEPGYENWKMQTRNEWIVDNCTHLMALHDGTAGGTNNCVKYAAKVGRPTVNVWDSWQSWLRSTL